MISEIEDLGESRPDCVASGQSWQLLSFAEVTSTNQVAAKLDPWTAVTSQRQTGGRGRHGRHWVSDDGGLWLSAVVPTPGPASQWSILPLAAAWAARQALEQLGVSGIRLRWPNDIMIGRRKLAGILVERHRADTAVIGIGINHHNAPEENEPDLCGTTIRLSELLPALPSLETVRDTLLERIAFAQNLIVNRTPERITEDLNSAWPAHPVQLVLRPSKTLILGKFLGVTPEGDLRIATENQTCRVYSPLDVECMRETPAFFS